MAENSKDLIPKRDPDLEPPRIPKQIAKEPPNPTEADLQARIQNVEKYLSEKLPNDLAKAIDATVKAYIQQGGTVPNAVQQPTTLSGILGNIFGNPEVMKPIVQAITDMVKGGGDTTGFIDLNTELQLISKQILHKTVTDWRRLLGNTMDLSKSDYTVGASEVLEMGQ